MSNEHEHAGPTVTILFRQIFDGPPVAVSAHRDEDEAARALGRLALERRMPAGAYFTERIPLVGAGLSATTSVDVLEPVGEPEGLDVRGLDDVDGGLVEAVADRIALAMGGRHLDPATPGGAVALETARDVIGMARLGVYEPAQPDVDPAGAADLVARQCVADLAGALGLNEPRPWPDMCREVRAHRHVAEDGEAERVKTATALGMPRPTADQPTPSWRAIRAQARRARDLGGESFVSALRNVLDDCGPGVADMTRPELLGQVCRLVDGRLGVDESAALRARLVRELDPELELNVDRLDAASDAVDLRPGMRPDQVATAAVRAYLGLGD